MKSYIWKAERQDNNNIHFHITSNQFIHYRTIQDRWNSTLSVTTLLNDFQKKHGHYNPHSTEIKAVRKIDEIEKYLQKYYLKKEEDKKPIEGKLWDCSLNLKSIPYPSFIQSEESIKHINQLIHDNPTQLIDRDECSIFWYTEKQRKKFLSPDMTARFNEFTTAVKNFQRKTRQLSPVDSLAWVCAFSYST